MRAIKFCETHQIDRTYCPLKNRKSGRYVCRKCEAERFRAWHAANLRKSNAQSRAWRLANQGRANASKRAWANVNPDKVRTANRAYMSKPGIKEHYRYYMLSYRRAQLLASMSDPCALLRDV